MTYIPTHSPKFLQLVHRVVTRSQHPVGVRALSKRLEVAEEDMEAALIHLVRRMELTYTKRKRPRS